eukprot:g8793.t1
MLRLLACGGLALVAMAQEADEVDDKQKAAMDRVISVSIDLTGEGVSIDLTGEGTLEQAGAPEDNQYVASYEATNIGKQWEKMGTTYDTETAHKMRVEAQEEIKSFSPKSKSKKAREEEDSTPPSDEQAKKDKQKIAAEREAEEKLAQEIIKAVVLENNDGEPTEQEKEQQLEQSKTLLGKSTFKELTANNVMHFVHHHQPFLMLFLCECWEDLSAVKELEVFEQAMTGYGLLNSITRLYVYPVMAARFGLNAVYQMNRKVITEFGASPTKSMTKFVTYGLELDKVPKEIKVEVVQECCGDKFSLSVGSKSTTGFMLTITREDKDATDWGQFLKVEWELDEPMFSLPLFVIDNIPVGSNNEKYIFRSWEWKDQELVVGKQLALFTKSFFESQPKPPLLVRSQPEQLNWKETYGPGKVNELVGTTFKEFVMDTTKDVLVMIYSPQCGASMAVMPLFEQTAVALKDDEGVRVARLDRTKNDLPVRGISVYFYPTVYLFRAGEDKVKRKLDFSDFNGSKEMHDKTKPHSHFSLELLTKFVREHGDTFHQYLGQPVTPVKKVPAEGGQPAESTSTEAAPVSLTQSDAASAAATA